MLHETATNCLQDRFSHGDKQYTPGSCAPKGGCGCLRIASVDELEKGFIYEKGFEMCICFLWCLIILM